MARFESKGTWFETHGENAPRPQAPEPPRGELFEDLSRVYKDFSNTPIKVREGFYGAAYVLDQYHYRIGRTLARYAESERRREAFIQEIRRIVEHGSKPYTSPVVHVAFLASALGRLDGR